MKLKEQYYTIPVNMYDDGVNIRTNKEIYVPDSDIKHWINTNYTDEEVLEIAMQTLREYGDKDIIDDVQNGDFDIDDAYYVLIDFELYEGVRALQDFIDRITNFIETEYTGTVQSEHDSDSKRTNGNVGVSQSDFI